MRYYFYFIFGIVSSLFGWFLSQMFLLGTGKSVKEGIFPRLGEFHPDIFVLPVVAGSLAVGMVATEIFLSNPTRYKANRRVLPPYLWRALLTGLAGGLVASLLTKLLYLTDAPAEFVRIFSWSLIGMFTGLGEALSWRLRSIEAGTQKANQRLWKGSLFGLGAGFFAAVLMESIRGLLGDFVDPLGFLILGLFIGVALSFATSPAYQVALRAGEGFEAIDPKFASFTHSERPRLKKPKLNFVTGDEYNFIEEGLSIQLPIGSKQELIIGSSTDADIYIPNIPDQAASLIIDNHQVKLRCLAEATVQIQSMKLIEGSKAVTLRHNQILTFYHANEPEKYYRFVFYDRFLDPQS